MNQKIKISQLPAKGSNLAAQDLIEIAEFTGTGYVSKSITGQEIIDAAVGNVDWGDIGGTLSAQTDLQNALNAKQDDITLTTTGSSGASTLVGSTLNVPNYTLSGLGGVPTSRTLTINGVTQDLSANRTFTISTGITIGSTAIASGTVGRILFEGAGNVVQESSSLFWDATNNRLGIGTDTPAHTFQVYRNTSAGYLASFNSGATLNTNASLTIRIENANLPSIQALSPGAGGFNTFALNPLGGNVLIGTTTDAGFRLDVNGTIRASLGQLLVGGGHYLEGLATSSTDVTLRFRRSADNGWVRFTLGASSQFFMSGETGTGELRVGAASGHFLTLYSGGSERIRLFNSTGNIGINTTTDAGFRLDVNGTARVQGDLTIQNNSSLSWGNGNFVQVNNANPDWKFYVQSSLILTLSNTQLTFGLAARTRDLIASSDASFDIGQQFARYRNGWLSGQLKVGDATAVNASAKVQIDSTSQGFLPPRMTTTQKNAIASPAAGLMVYDTTLNVISYYNGSMWI